MDKANNQTFNQNIIENFLKDNNYQYQKYIKSGSQSTVVQAYSYYHQANVAIKIFLNSQDFEFEKEILEKMKGERFIHQILSTFDNQNLNMHALVTELYDCNYIFQDYITYNYIFISYDILQIQGDLSAILSLNKLTFDQVLALSFQMLKALTILYENGIIHSDIKPDNILYSRTKNEFILNKNIHIPSSNYAAKIQNLPDYTNDIVKNTLNKLGKFIYKYSQYDDQDAVELGLYQLKNGSVYQGQWKNGQRHGRGKKLQQDGCIYEGYWKNNMANGYGILINSDGDVYEGQWKNDKFNGFGTFTFFDGAYYIGNWLNDKQHGNGIEIRPNGTKYDGQYFESKKQGKGKFILPNGSQYEGQFLNNNFHGFGIYIWSDRRIYIGEWKDNLMDGQGDFKWPDGRKYIGSYIQDKKSGYGEFYWTNGKVYKGQWLDGKQHGKGMWTGVNGKERQGEWENGKLVRWLDNQNN
ncbi:hypothetical protein ABPG74_016147 [Tetrahymena malaccensis]